MIRLCCALPLFTTKITKDFTRNHKECCVLRVYFFVALVVKKTSIIIKAKNAIS